MADVLTELVDKQDNFEVVRDQIALIIFENQAAQQILATAALEDPDLWKLRVFSERANPWEQFLNAPDDAVPDQSPIVNVWYENGTFDQSKSDVVERQNHVGIFNVDVYGFGIAQSDGSGGQIPGDLAASRNAERGIRFVRNFLMASQNTYLQLRNDSLLPTGPAVGMRFPQGIEKFQVDLGEESAHQILGIRFALQVTFNEFSLQAGSVSLAQVNVDIHRDSDGLLIAEKDTQY